MQVSSSGSMSTVSREDNLVFSSEDSSSPGYESELELGLGLSLGGAAATEHHRLRSLRGARILTANDFPSVVSSSASSSSSVSGLGPGSSSSSSSLSRASVTAGTKRSADSVAVANGSGSSPVVGWPPIRAYRMNSMVSHTKSPSTEALSLMDEENRCASDAVRKAENGNEKRKGNSKENGRAGNTLFVKVNMDGIPIGRKIDLSSHMSYEALARTLEDMFNEPNAPVKLRSSRKDGPSRLLDGSSENVLTYEDKDGDWMLVGDVPWGMFLCSVKRLRIMRTSEANGLAPRLQERNGRQRCQPV